MCCNFLLATDKMLFLIHIVAVADVICSFLSHGVCSMALLRQVRWHGSAVLCSLRRLLHVAEFHCIYFSFISYAVTPLLFQCLRA